MSKQYLRILSLFLLTIEGMGIRLFDEILFSPISFWTGLLFVLNFKTIKRMPLNCWIVLFAFFGFYFVFSFLKGTEPTLFLFAGWLSAFFVLSNYINGKASFEEDLYKYTKICVIYSLLHIPIIIFAKDSLIDVFGGIRVKTFMYLFYYTWDVNEVLGLNRIQGFCWEPSCWNCLLNLNLALSLAQKRDKKEIIMCVVAILFVFSTTGFATMLSVFAVYLLLYIRKMKLSIVVVVALIGLLVVPVAYNNIIDKLDTGSGATRYGDFYIATYVIQHNPVLGADLNNIVSNQGAMAAKSANWGFRESSLSLYDEVGMVNSFAALFVEWGLFITLFIFYLMFSSPLFHKKKTAFIVCSTLLFVLMGAPIARTGFFYIFPLSSIILFYNKQSVAHKLHLLLKKNKSI